MNKFLALTFLLIFSTLGFTQSSSSKLFEKKYIVSSGLENVTEFFLTSFEKADWDRYRLKEDRRVLNFDNDIVIELLSAEELIERNISYDERKIQSKLNQFDDNTLFVINSNGHIIEQKKSVSK
jgi:hypothetical protein